MGATWAQVLRVPLEGVIQFEKPASSSSRLNKWGRVALLAGGDVLALLLLAAIETLPSRGLCEFRDHSTTQELSGLCLCCCWYKDCRRIYPNDVLDVHQNMDPASPLHGDGQDALQPVTNQFHQSLHRHQYQQRPSLLAM
ncbi:hypothetical protein CJ030_MR1G000264 [Morella rubra]|uniref:Uncharacterized protein n=1 Tax=Morella rubra TaxID=262757 RepID=A0A6A1WRP7_9ROSI|nr:hypothetical protein CJ030_MR1G000264 [Morella rubra]